jgi:hypothetical protein
MRKMLLLAATGLSLGYGAGSAEAGGIRDRDVSTQREVSTGRSPASAPARPAAASSPDQSDYGLAPGFVTPYGYPLPPYADGNNFQTIYTGR